MIWNKKDVVKFILACRRDEGIPMFVTRFAGKPLKVDGKGIAIAKCWGGRGTIEGTYFFDIPKEDYEMLEENIGDWRKLLEKYGTSEQIREAESYGIYLKGFKLPKIRR